MNRRLPNECFRAEGRKTWYITPGQIQRDLDRCLAYHSLKRSQQGYRLKRRISAQAFHEALEAEYTTPPHQPSILCISLQLSPGTRRRM